MGRERAIAGGERETMLQTDLVNNNEAAWALWCLSGLKEAGY